jgi:hypothetical protein
MVTAFSYNNVMSGDHTGHVNRPPVDDTLKLFGDQHSGEWKPASCFAWVQQENFDVFESSVRRPKEDARKKFGCATEARDNWTEPLDCQTRQ